LNLSQNFEIGLRDPGDAHSAAHFVVRTQEGSVFHLCNKFEADSSIRSKVIKGTQNCDGGYSRQMERSGANVNNIPK